jgi:Kef-type K+ transport system membrane component KefB
MPTVIAANFENAAILLDLFIMLAAAKLMAEVFERLRQPAVVGEILAGIIIGPSLLGGCSRQTSSTSLPNLA